MTNSPDQVTALDLPMVQPLPEATQTYFDICQEKLGLIANVLRACVFDIASVAGFFNMTNRVASAIHMQPNPEYHAQAR